MDWPARPVTTLASPFRNMPRLEAKSAPFGTYDSSLETYHGIAYERLTYPFVRRIGGLGLVDVGSTRHPPTQLRQITAVSDDQDVGMDLSSMVLG